MTAVRLWCSVSVAHIAIILLCSSHLSDCPSLSVWLTELNCDGCVRRIPQGRQIQPITAQRFSVNLSLNWSSNQLHKSSSSTAYDVWVFLWSRWSARSQSGIYTRLRTKPAGPRADYPSTVRCAEVWLVAHGRRWETEAAAFSMIHYEWRTPALQITQDTLITSHSAYTNAQRNTVWDLNVWNRRERSRRVIAANENSGTQHSTQNDDIIISVMTAAAAERTSTAIITARQGGS